MKYMFASDVHGSAHYCRKMLEAYCQSGADRLILLGDLLYHGPRNDLPQEYAPKQVIAMLNEYKNEIIAVRGNCEAEVDQMVLEFPVMADYAILVLNGLTFFATHGHLFNRCAWAGGRYADRSFSGDAGVAACGVSGRLLLTDKDMLDGSGII